MVNSLAKHGSHVHKMHRPFGSIQAFNVQSLVSSYFDTSILALRNIQGHPYCSRYINSIS